MDKIKETEELTNKIPIKTDLFRFATLRGPQSITKKRRKLGFVEHPDHSKSHFLKGIKPDTNQETLKLNFQNLADSFSPFTSVEAVKQFSGDLWGFSMWLGKNQNNLLDSAALTKEVSLVQIPPISDVLQLWDNVFYDIITRTNPQVRQACLQLLVSIHFLENHSNGREPKDYKRIAKSRVIIPSVFTEKKSEKKTGFQQRSSQNSALRKQQEKAEKVFANQVLTGLQEMKGEFIDLGLRYQEDYEEAYDEALDAHTEKIEKLRNSKQEVSKVEPVSLSEINIQQEPSAVAANSPFQFSYPKPLSRRYTSRKISNEARDFIEENRLLDSPIEKAISLLDKQIKEQSILASRVLKETPRSVLVGGVKLRTSRNYIPTYSIKTQIAKTSTEVRVKVYLIFNAGYANAFFQSQNLQISIGRTNMQTYDVLDSEIDILPSPDADSLFVELKEISFPKNEFDKRIRVSVSGDFQLDNDKSYSFKSKETGVYSQTEGIAEEVEVVVQANNDVHYGINKIGVADYRKVEQELCCYIPGEVSQIENIMAREYKEKMTRNLVRSEDTVETTVENEIEELNDTTTATRFEMNSEISEVLNKDSSANLGFSTGASGEYFGTTFSASMDGDFSTSQSSSKSDTTARTYAEDVTRRALERVVQKNTIKRTTKIIKEFEENNKHGYDNRTGGEHVTGVFRWIDKVYKNQLVNYGKRLVYEFMLPEPARYYKELIVLDIEDNTSGGGSTGLPEPVTLVKNGITEIDSITPNNYQSLCALYGVSAPAPKDAEVTLSETYSRVVPRNEQANTTSFQFSSPLMIPTDYLCTEIKTDINFNIFRESHWDYHWHITVNAGGTHTFERPPTIGYLNDVHHRSHTNNNPQSSGTITPTVLVRRVDKYTFVLTAKCELKESVLNAWKQEVYDMLVDAYDQQYAAYLQDQAAGEVDDAATAEAAILKTNPKYNKQFIMNELKRLCIEMMLDPFDLPQGKDFYYPEDLGPTCPGVNKGENKKIPQYKLSSELDSYSRQVKFFEQAFDWTILSHVFYPYYWAKKCEWENLFQSQDSVDHVLQEFLQSGMGRVLVPVREGFEDAVVYFMETGEIWNGTGLVLDTDDELYLSIIDETTVIEGKVEDSWETIVPTALTLIQGQSAFLDNEGLPCCHQDDLTDIKTSKAELGLLETGE